MLRKSIRQFTIPEAIIMPWTWQAIRMCWTLPSGAATHVGTDISAAGLTKFMEGGGFKYWKHRVRGQGWAAVFAAVGREAW